LKNLPDNTEVRKGRFDRVFLQIKLKSIEESRGIVRCVGEIEIDLVMGDEKIGLHFVLVVVEVELMFLHTSEDQSVPRDTRSPSQSVMLINNS
jgi:hypothetical protein